MEKGTLWEIQQQLKEVAQAYAKADTRFSEFKKFLKEVLKEERQKEKENENEKARKERSKEKKEKDKEKEKEKETGGAFPPSVLSASDNNSFCECNTPLPITTTLNADITSPPLYASTSSCEATEYEDTDKVCESSTPKQNEDTGFTGIKKWSSRTEKERDLMEFFTKTYSEYPRHISKKQAYVTYTSKFKGLDRAKSVKMANDIYKLMLAYKKAWKAENKGLGRAKEFIPYFSTWLNANF